MIPEGWYPDPADESQERWWDGEGWTEQVRPSEAEDETGVEVVSPAPSRWKVWLPIALLAVVGIGLIVLFFVMRDGDDPQDNPTGTNTPTVARSATPSTSALPTLGTQSPTPTPSPTPTVAPTTAEPLPTETTTQAQVVPVQPTYEPAPVETTTEAPAPEPPPFVPTYEPAPPEPTTEAPTEPAPEPEPEPTEEPTEPAEPAGDPGAGGDTEPRATDPTEEVAIESGALPVTEDPAN
jgi:outer membrane biosynthesis protein TonB